MTSRGAFFHVQLIDFIKKWFTAINKSLILLLNELWRVEVFTLLLSFIIYCHPLLMCLLTHLNGTELDKFDL